MSPARLAAAALAALLLAGCATVGPSISREELKSAREFYEVKSRRLAYEQFLRVRTIGDRLLEQVPAELHEKKPEPAVGFILDDLTLVTGRVFGIPGIEPQPGGRESPRHRDAVLVAAVVPQSPADRAGLKAGDLLLRIGARKTRTVSDASSALRQAEPGKPVRLTVEREGARFEREVVPGARRYPVSFLVEDQPEVNAFAAPGRIAVTTGLLRFATSDDEVAVVLGHELAHLTQGHIVKGMGTGILAGIVGVIAGTAVDIVAPGAGGIISQVTEAGLYAPFSKNFEREADYVGLKYAHKSGYRIESGIEFWDRFATELPRSQSESFFNTHPTSPERLLRLQKTVEELKAAVPAPAPVS